MRFSAPLIPGRLRQRYKRFLADVTLADGTLTTVHCPNPGRMLGLEAPGLEVWLSRSANPKRTRALTLEIVRAPEGTLVGINTGLPNGLVAEALAQRQIEPLAAYTHMRREVRYGEASRIDFLLEDEAGHLCYLEIKNVHLRRTEDLAEFPDCVTARGARHLDELGRMVAAGHRAVMLYVIQRADCRRFTLAEDLDPAYAHAFARARERGVEALAYRCTVSPESIALGPPVPLDHKLIRRELSLADPIY